MIRHAFHLLIRSLLLIGLLALVYAMLSIPPVAAASKAQPAGALVPTAQGGHVTVLVLDMSGSMSTNDPQGYRCSAADAYIDLSGQSDSIGLVGLDGTGARGGSHNFESAISWLDPQSTATVQNKQSVKSALANKSNNCKPDMTTPTDDALNQAYNMLDAFTTQNKNISGSVILLTDGAPCPDLDAQVTAIQSELIPKFASRKWPVDTIALGHDAPLNSTAACGAPGTLSGTYHTFLSGIASGTHGKFYDDGVGPVPGISALNIAGFFVDIFARYSGETPSLAIGVQQLNGSTTQQNFPVVDGATKLDVVIVKESASVNVSLANPASQTISQNTAGVFVSQDNFHAIYSITSPPAGAWIATASGQGRFMLYSLTKTDITVTVTQVAVPSSSLNSTLDQQRALPLGQTLEITAKLESGGHPYNDNAYSVNGDISSSNPDCRNPAQAIVLKRNGSSYQGTVVIPLKSKPGTYTVQVCASTGSLQNVVASGSFNVSLAVFPIPSLYSTETKAYTDTSDKPLDTTVIQWFPLLQFFYSLPIIDHFSGWPLQGHPAQPEAVLNGEVQSNGTPYQGATIRATAVAVTSCKAGLPPQEHVPGALPVTINQDDQGHFTALFEPTGPGLYEVIFETSGSFADSQGSFGPQALCVNANLRGAFFDENKTAGLITLVYFLLLFILFSGLWFFATPRPFGKWIRDQGSPAETNRSFANATRVNLASVIYTRNILNSRSAGMPGGLRFRFRRGQRIDVRPTNGSGNWRMSDGSQLPGQFQPIRELVYRSPEAGPNSYDGYLRYTIVNTPQQSGGDGGGGYSSSGDYGGYRDTGSYDGYGNQGSSSQRGRRKQKAAPSFSAYDSYAPPKSRKGKGRKGQDLAPWERYDN
ncbi:MAG TPA: vWA domain-containing protein [Ktedonobacteraceae bacterium]